LRHGPLKANLGNNDFIPLAVDEVLVDRPEAMVRKVEDVGPAITDASGKKQSSA